METERWVIYEHWTPDDGETEDDGPEYSWHHTAEKAMEVAKAAHAKTGMAYRIDLCWGTGGVARWECEGCQADVWGIGFKGGRYH